MIRKTVFLIVLLFLTLGSPAATLFLLELPAYIDPAKIQGGLLASRTLYVGQVDSCWIRATDTTAVSLDVVAGPTGLDWQYDDVNGIATYQWTPTGADVGIHYAVVAFSDSDDEPLTEVATLVFKVRLRNQKPTLFFGCGAH